ncbi:uncharacterized protein [Blastocystis hominis]|uniref:Uncharacterized protein n=1 Tax=Blastocystis hominis TaxID=12968 RepID=D8MB72_BLAHO|nr:uncharacterized protein [Blastocystis hominis]CBK25311.2 unnamed protein product [Blastocystis hominis]|eukprot:XP_012899359.1 uncharacterized protein [Blastocystis hominis]
MNYHVEEPNLALSSISLFLISTPDIPTALSDIWGSVRNDSVLQQIASSLVDICVNLGIKPHIHYYNCYPCDRIADLFYQSIEQHIAIGGQLHEKGLLFLVDRTVDPLIPLMHPITYEPMVMDLLPVGEGGEFEYRSRSGEDKSRTVLLNSQDRIWEAYKYEHIQNTAVWINKAVEVFQAEKEESKNSIQDIGNLIKTLPERKQRNDLFALHVTISRMCIDLFRDHALNRLIPLEQIILTGCDDAGSTPSQEKLLAELDAVLASEITMQDKRRLILMYAIARGLDSDTQRRLFQQSGLPMGDYSLVQNLKLLNVNLAQVGIEIRNEL